METFTLFIYLCLLNFGSTCLEQVRYVNLQLDECHVTARYIIDKSFSTHGKFIYTCLRNDKFK